MDTKMYARIESKLRRQARKAGLAIRSDRREPGFFYVIDSDRNTVVAGMSEGFAEFDLYDLAAEAWARLTPTEMVMLDKEAGISPRS